MVTYFFCDKRAERAKKIFEETIAYQENEKLSSRIHYHSIGLMDEEPGTSV